MRTLVVAIFGTTGELIKLAPVLRRLQESGDPALLVSTNQQVTQIPAMLLDFGLPSPTLALTDGHAGRDLESLRDIPGWLSTLGWRAMRNSRSLRGALRGADTEPLVLVHGDTMTTVLGAAVGRALGAPVAHVEAGLRSGDWRNPFPEELDRLATSKLATLHYAPGAWAADNLRRAGVAGEIVNTGANTVRDALALVPKRAAPLDLPEGSFGICSIHRFELLGNSARLEETLAALQRGASRAPILFIDHPVTAAALREAGLERYFDERLVRIPRQRYFDFISLLKSAEFLVTDSGGSQEECTALGIPCLIHRVATERQDGLDGGPVVLSNMELGPLDQFLADPDVHRRTPTLDDASPSAIIVNDLRARAHIAPV
jgi:UDP-N-acetylglucosamine 2-epimerase (non-hydrolysing)